MVGGISTSLAIIGCSSYRIVSAIENSTSGIILFESHFIDLLFWMSDSLFLFSDSGNDGAFWTFVVMGYLL
jgi:hypothetical protein